jgi:hypothetical protein
MVDEMRTIGDGVGTRFSAPDPYVYADEPRATQSVILGQGKQDALIARLVAALQQ